jgi:hypothetical protein
VAPPTFGHALHWYARRATSADNFGPWLDPRRFEAVRAFYRSEDEARALAILAALDARYVLATGAHAAPSPSVAHRLFRGLGAAGRHPHLGHFRLVAQGPPGGRGFPQWRLPAGTPPYRLFERVAGAVLAAPAIPGRRVSARLEMETDTGDRFVYVARAVAGADGIARMRVPYPTGAGPALRATGPYRVHASGWRGEARVSEAQVARGEEVAVSREASEAR